LNILTLVFGRNAGHLTEVYKFLMRKWLIIFT